MSQSKMEESGRQQVAIKHNLKENSVTFQPELYFLSSRDTDSETPARFRLNNHKKIAPCFCFPVAKGAPQIRLLNRIIGTVFCCFPKTQISLIGLNRLLKLVVFFVKF